jgi:hypothetical protein
MLDDDLILDRGVDAVARRARDGRQTASLPLVEHRGVRLLAPQILLAEPSTNRRFPGVLRERMMGLEPTTFCMASGSRVRAKERRQPHG